MFSIEPFLFVFHLFVMFFGFVKHVHQLEFFCKRTVSRCNVELIVNLGYFIVNCLAYIWINFINNFIRLLLLQLGSPSDPLVQLSRLAAIRVTLRFHRNWLLFFLLAQNEWVNVQSGIHLVVLALRRGFSIEKHCCCGLLRFLYLFLHSCLILLDILVLSRKNGCWRFWNWHLIDTSTTTFFVIQVRQLHSSPPRKSAHGFRLLSLRQTNFALVWFTSIATATLDSATDSLIIVLGIAYIPVA